MLVNKSCSSKANKQRKLHFNADSAKRRILMTTRLEKVLAEQYKVKSLPIRQGDIVKVVKGTHKGQTSTVSAVCRRTFCVALESIKRENSKKKTRPVLISPANVVITELKLTQTRRKQLSIN